MGPVTKGLYVKVEHRKKTNKRKGKVMIEYYELVGEILNNISLTFPLSFSH